MNLYTKGVLTVIALALVVLAARPAAVRADDAQNLYIEPGTSPIRNLNGGVTGDGKVVINMTTGDVWGFPTQAAGAPYPIDALSLDRRPPVSKPVYLGKFDFAAMKHGR